MEEKREEEGTLLRMHHIGAYQIDVVRPLFDRCSYIQTLADYMLARCK